ncbi:hypothetical protein DYB37_006882 [Aphanomyces astaci]|uniref:SF3 helicase domain-containing protein n=1 Tax=Aphanomyces astaci TaxID=112090 RepID=A0A3R6WE81_APHAT|nr:hypothetical protein DYB35_006344 [Aphanomyces astaci]RHZ34309.1 hypothetical protein DYB37_006882 [Aphanomyces astaci]
MCLQQTAKKSECTLKNMVGSDYCKKHQPVAVEAVAVESDNEYVSDNDNESGSELITKSEMENNDSDIPSIEESKMSPQVQEFEQVKHEKIPLSANEIKAMRRGEREEAVEVELTESEKASKIRCAAQRKYEREQSKKAKSVEPLDEYATLFDVLNECPIIIKFNTWGTEVESGAQRKILKIQKIIDLYPRFAPIIKECQRVTKLKGFKSSYEEIYNEAHRQNGEFFDARGELDDLERRCLKSKKPAPTRDMIFKYMMLIIASGRYRRERDTGVIYERVNNYFFKLAYPNPEDFLTDIFANNPLYSIYSTAQHRAQLINFIKRVNHKLFPFMKIDHDFIGYSNGILDLNTCEFTKTEDIGDRIVQVRMLYKSEFAPNAETPKFDASLRFQFGDDQTISDIMFLFGRAMTRDEDNFQIMVYQHGAGSSGKSLLTELLCATHGNNQVGPLSKSHQIQFGLSEHVDKQLIVCDDSDNIAKMLPKADFLSMTSHGSIKCPVKGKVSKDVARWNIPMVINSNYAPNYNDESGEIARRLVVIRYHKLIAEDKKNVGLCREIMDEELGTIIYRMRSTYLEYCKKYKGKTAMSFLSEHFKKSQAEARCSSNATARFITERCIFEEGASIAVADLTRELRAWCVDAFNRGNSKEDLNSATLALMNPNWEIKAVKHCKHCKGRHIRGCCGLYNSADRGNIKSLFNIRYKTDADREDVDAEADEDEGIEFDA